MGPIAYNLRSGEYLVFQKAVVGSVQAISFIEGGSLRNVPPSSNRPKALNCYTSNPNSGVRICKCAALLWTSVLSWQGICQNEAPLHNLLSNGVFLIGSAQTGPTSLGNPHMLNHHLHTCVREESLREGPLLHLRALPCSISMCLQMNYTWIPKGPNSKAMSPHQNHEKLPSIWLSGQLLREHKAPHRRAEGLISICLKRTSKASKNVPKSRMAE